MTGFTKQLALLVFLLSAPLAAEAQTVNAASCSSTDVQNAINTAVAGGTVSVPAGNCTWSNLVTLSKAITLNGAGAGVTKITLGSLSPIFQITKQTNGVTRISNITFVAGPNNAVFPFGINVGGPWPNGQPVIFQNDAFVTVSSDMIGVATPGGVILSHNTFNGTWDTRLIVIKDTGTTSWTTADTMGSRDTSGWNNIYIEDNQFVGGSNGITDCDDSCRMVVRHNTFGANGQDSGGINSHGEDSSPQGMRHFEIYNNSFLFPDKSCAAGNSSLSNINQWIWIRGGTGVIFNNNFDHLQSTCWGTKTEVRLSLRGAEDDRPQGTCSQVTYPVPHQLGQNHNGTSSFTDPIRFWGNTGTVISVSGGWTWNNPCGFNWNTFFQWGRDGENASLLLPILLSLTGGSVSGLGGSPKPGYTAYTYPHPLVQGSSSSNPVAPTNLAATVQ